MNAPTDRECLLQIMLWQQWNLTEAWVDKVEWIESLCLKVNQGNEN